MRAAVDMVLAKIAEDPQSGTCPNISYSHIQGPVASAFPTGSPFAFNPQHIPNVGAASPLRPSDRAAGSSHQLLFQAAQLAAASRGAYPQTGQGRQQQHQPQAFRWDSLKSPTAVDPAAFLRGYASPTSPGDAAPCFYRPAGQNPLTADLSPTYATAAYAPMLSDGQPAPPPQSFFSAAAAVAAATNQLIMQAAAMRNSSSSAGLKDQPMVYDLSAAPRFAYYSPTGAYPSPPTGDASVGRICSSLDSPDTGFGGSASSPPLTQAPPPPQQAFAQQPFYAAVPQQLFPPRNVTPTSPPAGATAAPAIPITRQQNQTPTAAVAYADGHLLGCYPTAVGGYDFFGLFPGNLQSPTQATYLPAPPTLAAVAEQPGSRGVPSTTGEHLHASLRQSGFSEEVATEISGALSTLSIHGILSIGGSESGGCNAGGAGGEAASQQPQPPSEVTSAVTTTAAAAVGLSDPGSIGE
ncbi:unnamed protein product [Schistocephalus solidus]|uniref:Uncharacterized protein n=1 Tax=Schistocephalus solidus TaxID=70667 RepID=A0A3P7BNB8_SCHSO|nr:unnamed protein product [Schistocephalus solidus]